MGNLRFVITGIEFSENDLLYITPHLDLLKYHSDHGFDAMVDHIIEYLPVIMSGYHIEDEILYTAGGAPYVQKSNGGKIDRDYIVELISNIATDGVDLWDRRGYDDLIEIWRLENIRRTREQLMGVAGITEQENEQQTRRVIL